MKFKLSRDVDAPLGPVWARVTDFSGIEAEIRGRGADLVRVGDWQRPAEGVGWRGAVPVRGKSKAIEGRVTRLVAEDVIVIESRVGGMETYFEITLVALSPTLTRVALVLDLSARTLSARLLLQTLKLARKRVLARLDAMVSRQAMAAEADWRRARAEADRG